MRFYYALNQLTRVDYLTQNKRVVYTYDLGGNITKEKIYTVDSNGTATLSDSKSYVYGDINWKDKLTTYEGQTITYDNIGNPLTYRDGFTFTWSNGRQLQSLTKDGETVNYTYDDAGMRLSKTVDGVEYTYLYQNGLLIQETVGNRILDYSYDANGRLAMVRYRIPEQNYDTSFYYALNSRGDVIGLYSATGTLIAKYTYDVWGNVLSVTNATGTEITSSTQIALLQSFRYRSYYYDTESNFYYLQSRYYDPVTHRFINADGLVSTGTGILGYNMFAYCENNPVNNYDPNGEKIYSADFIGPLQPGDYRVNDILGFDFSELISMQENSVIVSYGTIKTTNGLFKGWSYYVHAENTSTNTKRHIHISNGVDKYSQNIDGTPHDGSKGSPPNSIKKKLKNEGVWDWDANAKKQNKKSMLKCQPDEGVWLQDMPMYKYNSIYFMPCDVVFPISVTVTSTTTTFSYSAIFAFLI